MNRRSFLSALLAVPAAGCLVKKTGDPWTGRACEHRWSWPGDGNYQTCDLCGEYVTPKVALRVFTDARQPQGAWFTRARYDIDERGAVYLREYEQGLA